MKKTRVLLINDNRLLREGVTSVLNQQDDIKAVGTGWTDGSGPQGERLEPHVILADMGVFHEDGVRQLSDLKSQFPNGSVIAIGLTAESPKLREYVAAGVTGILLRHSDVQDIVNAIRTVASGLTVFPEVVSMSLFERASTGTAGGNTTRRHRAVRISRREKDVLALIAKGMTNKEIASELCIAVNTVKSHVHNLLDKLSMKTRLELADFALGRDF